MKPILSSILGTVLLTSAAAVFISLISRPSDAPAADSGPKAQPPPGLAPSFARGGNPLPPASRPSCGGQAPAQLGDSRILARLEAIVRDERPREIEPALRAVFERLGPDELAVALARFDHLAATDRRFVQWAGFLAVAARSHPAGPWPARHASRPPPQVTPEMAEQPKRRKFPEAFYQGRNSFAPDANTLPTITPGTVDATLPIFTTPFPFFSGIPRIADTSFTVQSFAVAAPDNSSLGAVASAEPVEADIWRVDGHTVYFFNQLRGLQVLDVSAPADPRLTATLRLPAVGEDLYLVPGPGGGAPTLVLLTRSHSGEAPSTRINLVAMTAGVPTLTHQTEVPGTLAGSRMAGDMLALVTTHRPTPAVDDSGDMSPWTTVVSQWRVSPGSAPQPAGRAEMDGADPVVAAGPDWLAVAVALASDGRTPAASEVMVFGLGATHLTAITPSPVRADGRIPDKFKLHWSNGVLTTIAEKRAVIDGFRPVTVLETFRTADRDGVVRATTGWLGRLELARGEFLYATRFSGDKAYVVTFLRTDPLWVVSLANPEHPVVAGHLEVPGWSTSLEPVGDMLFSVGWESNQLAVSLFDVADPAAPAMRRRINLGLPHRTRSEATHNEQALTILPAAGLAMIPYQTYDWNTGGWTKAVQLLDLDLTARDIRQRGVIRHEFDARRAEVVGNAVVSISQQALVTADITNRDQPAVLSEVALTWRVDRVLETDGHLLQIESGTLYGGGATVRISPASQTEAILAEVDLGDGRVCAAETRAGKLFVLRDNPNGAGGGGANTKRVLNLDIYDLSALPAMPLLGTCSAEPEDGASLAGEGGLLWPQPDRPCVVLTSPGSPMFFSPWQSGPINRWPTLVGTTALDNLNSIMMIAPPAAVVCGYRMGHRTASLVVFNSADATAPSASGPFSIGNADTAPNGIARAGDGLLAMGASVWQAQTSEGATPPPLEFHAVLVVEIGPTGDPVTRPLIDLPGALFAVGDLDRDGFLAYTRGADAQGRGALQVSACDGFDAYEITTLEDAPDTVASDGSWSLYLADDGGAKRYDLTEEGQLTHRESIQLGWRPFALRWLDGVLLGRDSRWLFAAGANAGAPSQWPLPGSAAFGGISAAADGCLLVPQGPHGVERFAR